MAGNRPLRVGVVGAGVSGLSCARELERAGAEVDVFEAAGSVGGRVRTEEVEGHLLDVGFQILLDGYPEVQRSLDLQALSLKSFAPGALLASGGRRSVVANPLLCPGLLPGTLRTAASWGFLSSILDVLRLLKVALSWLWSSPYQILKEGDANESTESYLERLGLSDAIVQQFFKPFFEAIYVAPISQQSAVMFQFVVRMLALGGACLPQRGMRAVSEQLAASLKKPVQLSTPVEKVCPDSLGVKGEQRKYDAVVVAADWPAACGLLGEKLPAVKATRSATWYFSLPSPAPVMEPLIVLQSCGDPSEPADAASRVVNVGFPSVVQPSYAPKGKHLAAVTVMGPPVKEDWVRAEVERFLGVDCTSWKLLKCYDISFHQPAQTGLKVDRLPLQVDGVWCCGDHRANPTLDGAMRSGRAVAEAITKGWKAS